VQRLADPPPEVEAGDDDEHEADEYIDEPHGAWAVYAACETALHTWANLGDRVD
jgi:hypothetical protein